VRTFGVRNAATRQPMARNLYMRIGSTSKTFTVTAILLLADQRNLGLDDPIDRYVTGVPSGNQIALRQLAAMRSGLYNYADDTNQDLPQQPFRQWAPRERLEIAGRRPLLFPPGSGFDYSNTNTVLLGREGLRSVARVLHRAEHLATGGHDPHGVPGRSRDAVAACPRLLQDAGRQGRRCNGLCVMGLGVGKHDLAQRHARVDARLRNGKAAVARHEARARPVLAGTPGRRRRTVRPGDRKNQNGWIGHNGNIMSYMAYPYYLPSERMTMVVLLNSGVDVPGSWAMMQDITRIITPNNLWEVTMSEAVFC
jgi:D-alanyl-D-alanine carboxypeptidase